MAQSFKMPETLKFLQYALKVAIFTLLLVVCYIYFMKAAIVQFKKEATTVTERSIPIEDLGGYKSPAIVICPNPAFKPSISDLHGFTYPTRDLFNMKTPFSEKYKYIFNKTTVRSQFDAFSYADDLVFKAFGTVFHEGDNLVEFGPLKINVEFKKVRTAYEGVCYVIQQRNVENWKEDGALATVQYKKTLSLSDRPKGFKIFFVERDEWQGMYYVNTSDFMTKIL